MANLVREAGWCCINLNTTEGRIFLQERWLYNWLNAPNTSAWTLAEKRAFHNSADRAIWAAWSYRATMRVSGSGHFVDRFRTSQLPINLDIRWVTANAHWTVNVMKIPAGQYRQSNVVWNNRVINLDTEDFTTRTFAVAGSKHPDTQVPVAHEFGHTIGNTAVLSRGDEYPATSPNVNDHSSIMNHGHQLRTRHFQSILNELNQMVPGAVFTVGSLH